MGIGTNPRHRAALTAVKVIHTLIWFSIESCMAYVLWAGFTRRSDRRAATAAGVVAGETLIFVANGFRCPLAQIAERLGAESGSVTDIYLPRWFARNLPAIHVPLIGLAGYLNARNLQETRTGSDDANSPLAERRTHESPAVRDRVFDRLAGELAAARIPAGPGDQRPVTEADIAGLPDPVQRTWGSWASWAGLASGLSESTSPVGSGCDQACAGCPPRRGNTTRRSPWRGCSCYGFAWPGWFR